MMTFNTPPERAGGVVEVVVAFVAGVEGAEEVTAGLAFDAGFVGKTLLIGLAAGVEVARGADVETGGVDVGVDEGEEAVELQLMISNEQTSKEIINTSDLFIISSSFN